MWRQWCFLSLLFFLLAGCGQPLPFPTPAQHNLIAVISPETLIYQTDDTGQAVGLEYDLIDAFAQELGVAVEYRVVPPEDLKDAIAGGKAHLAAGWLPANEAMQTTPPIYLTSNTLIQRDASLPIEEIANLQGKTVYALPGTRQWQFLQALHERSPEIRIAETGSRNTFEVLQQLDAGQIDYLLLDSRLSDIAIQHFPALQPSLNLGDETPIVWWLGPSPNQELKNRLSQFVERIQRDGTLARIEDRYFGHVRRLTRADIIKFLGQIQSDLGRYRRHFQQAQEASGIDWRLLAAVAYHESNWDPMATSRTGVRGMMMLTEETADRLGVKNRLDPAESIEAGARYISMLKSFLPDSVSEPDRTWLALAAYNLGPGHFNAGRALARQLKADPNSWYEMKRILPLLSQPKYYNNLKTGRARGGEAVILVENIRSYYDILLRNKPIHRPKTDKNKKATAPVKTGGQGLKPPKQ